LLLIRLVDLVESDRSEARIVGVDGGVVESDGHRADGPGNIAGDAGFIGDLVGDFPSELC